MEKLAFQVKNECLFSLLVKCYGLSTQRPEKVCHITNLILLHLKSMKEAAAKLHAYARYTAPITLITSCGIHGKSSYVLLKMTLNGEQSYDKVI